VTVTGKTIRILVVDGGRAIWTCAAQAARVSPAQWSPRSPCTVG